jgi:hypothetical protein
MKPTSTVHFQIRSAHSAYVLLPVYRASLAARLKKHPLEMVFL